MNEPTTAKERARREERAERVRDAFRNMPGFRETLQASQEGSKAGKFVTPEEVARQHLSEG